MKVGRIFIFFKSPNVLNHKIVIWDLSLPLYGRPSKHGATVWGWGFPGLKSWMQGSEEKMNDAELIYIFILIVLA